MYQYEALFSFNETPRTINTATKIGEQISFPSSRENKGFSTKLRSSFGVIYQKIGDVGMKMRELKANEDCSFWSSAKRHKGFPKINDTVNYSIQKWIIYHPSVIQSPIAND